MEIASQLQPTARKRREDGSGNSNKKRKGSSGSGKNKNKNKNKNKKNNKSKNKERGWAATTHAFPTEYGDHFETPVEAYRDIAPILHWLARALNKKPKQLRIYDPYYCDGAVQTHLRGLGFANVVNRNRDFYKDVEENKLPPFDVVVTNPPYSGAHKEKAVEWCVKTGKPWFMLMPNYVATKQYYTQAIVALGRARPFYMVPHTTYEFSHPEGTGHASSPFFSIWFAHLGPDHHFTGRSWTQESSSVCALLAWDVDDLKDRNAVPTAVRPNPQRRKKLKLMRSGEWDGRNERQEGEGEAYEEEEEQSQQQQKQWEAPPPAAVIPAAHARISGVIGKISASGESSSSQNSRIKF